MIELPEALAAQITERPTFHLDGADYYLDSVPREQEGMLETIAIVEEEIERHRISMEVAQIAKNGIIDQFRAIVGVLEAKV